MTVVLAEHDVTLHCGDVRDILAHLPSESVNCCVTSPPYYGLRDYGVDGQIGLEPSPAEYVETLRQVFAAVRRVDAPQRRHLAQVPQWWRVVVGAYRER